MSEIVEFLLKRRSVLAVMLREPGPDAEQLRTILTAGARVPDHGKLAPWRFVIFEGAARTALGELLAARFREGNPHASADQVEEERGRFERAPVIVGVVSSPVEHSKIPEWEQVLSAGAVCQNILTASLGMGFGAQWLTQWPSYDSEILKSLGISKTEKIAGFIYIGTPDAAPSERARPDIDEITSYWSG